MADRTSSEFDRQTRVAFNAVLSAANPATEVSDATGNDTHLWHVAQAVASLVQHMYEFGLNPLTELRKYFPDFEWRYWEVEGDGREDWRRHFVAQVAREDFTWIARLNDEWTGGLVSAKRRSNSPAHKFFLALDSHVGERIREALERADAQIVSTTLD